MSTEIDRLRTILQQANRVDTLIGFELGLRCATQGASAPSLPQEVPSGFTVGQLRQIIRVMALSGEMSAMKVEMIKVVRALSDLGLKEAKDLVESVLSQLPTR